MLAEPQTQNAMIPAMPTIPDIHTTEAGFKLAELAAKSGLCKTRNPFDAFFVIGYGMELGIPPMTALRTIHVINNTPTCSGQAMLALIRRSGKVTVTITGSATEAKVHMKRRDTGDEYTAEWNIARANAAGITGKDTWKKFPQQMLQWRAVSEAAVFLCSDIIGGLYTVEEIAPQITVDEAGEPVDTTVITISKPEPVTPPAPFPEVPTRPASMQPGKWVYECLDDGTCLEPFKALCKELGILTKADHDYYLAELSKGRTDGKVMERYSQFDLKYVELEWAMRSIHEALNTPVTEPEPAPAVDPVATTAAQITVDDTKNLLNHQTGSSTRKTPEVADDYRLPTGGKSPFATSTDTSSGENPAATGATSASPSNAASDKNTIPANVLAQIDASIEDIPVVTTNSSGSAFNRGLDTYQQQQEQQQAQSVNDDIDAALTRAMELSE